MMNWKPTPGLKLAESVLQDIMNAAIACGMPPITNPEFRHGAKQIIANALDGFRPQAVSTSEDRNVFAENGYGRDDDYSHDTPFDIAAEPLMEANPSTVILEKDAPTSAKRRGRGRPKLSAAEKKKRKAAKQANAVEAEAAQ